MKTKAKPPTAAELIGRSARFNVPLKTGESGFSVDVTITDVRHAYGRTDVQVKPDCGKGYAWTSLKHLTLP